MKNHLFIIFLLFTSSIFAQENNDKTIFLDSLWNETTEGNHKYYRIIKDYNLEKEDYKVYNYYKSGALQMEGRYSEKELITWNGSFVWYYENGNKSSKVTYANSKKIGRSDEWHKNGVKKSEGEYIFNEKTKQNNFLFINFWNSNNKQLVINGNGYLEDDAEDINVKGSVKNGLRDEVWIGFDKNLKNNYTENYSNGILVSGMSKDLKNNTYEYVIINKMPEPKKGMQDFYEFISKKIKLPKSDKDIKGKIILSFIVEKDGEISDIKVIKSLDTKLDNAAIDVLNKYKNWNPGKLRGINIRARFSIPIVMDIKAE